MSGVKDHQLCIGAPKSRNLRTLALINIKGALMLWLALTYLGRFLKVSATLDCAASSA
jgi:hypothetical protein